MDKLLSPALRQLADDERQLLAAILQRLDGWEARPAETGRLREAIEGLDDLFLLVVTGEFNAGKSRLINVLLGGRFLEEGVTPTTQEVQVLIHGTAGTRRARSGYLVREIDAPLLRELHLVDTPGANAIIREHEALTRDFLPRADLILFVTSADRPFSESERQFLTAIRRWGKSIVFVINKADLLDSASDRDQVLGFVRGAASALVDGQPAVFMLSARQALDAQEAGDADALVASGWTALSAWLFGALTARERIRLKLENPLGVAEAVLAEGRTEIDRRQGLLAGDAQTLTAVDRGLDDFATEIRGNLSPRLDRIDRILMQIRERGEVFLDEHFRLTRIRSLLDSERLRSAFETEVIADAAAEVNREIDGLVDWSVDQEYSTWHTVEARIRSLAEGGAGTVGSAGGPGGFAARRQATIAQVSLGAGAVIQTFNARAESLRITADIQDTLTKAGLAEVGAIGMGLVLLATKAAFLIEFTGVLAAGVLAVFGLTLLPQRRRQASKQLRERVDALRADLRATLQLAFDREIEASGDRMRTAYAPYRRFVSGELDRLRELAETCDAQLLTIADLRLRIDRILDEPDSATE
ncbi:MAG TPA: dynamin family protein [Anaerolineae bacterium]|nr:dynamin family protein [Ardenticatenia bacterium]HRA19360.1 dynamin family protein [Anaerolineae bacterium]